MVIDKILPKPGISKGCVPFMPTYREGFGLRASFLPFFAPEGGAGEGGEGSSGEGGEGGSGAGAGAGQGSPKPSDAEAKLLKEVMKFKNALKEKDEALKRFEGIDPDAVKALLAEKEEAEKAKREAEEAKLRATGDFDALKKRMADEHEKSLKAERARTEEAIRAQGSLTAQIHELTVGQNFAGSKFVTEETILTPSKARALYESHFDVVNGQVVAYDRPRSQQGREPLVNALGQPVPFDAAIKTIIEADPDRDALLRSKARPGAGSANNPTLREGTNPGTRESNASTLQGISRIGAALSAGALKAKK